MAAVVFVFVLAGFGFLTLEPQPQKQKNEPPQPNLSVEPPVVSSGTELPNKNRGFMDVSSGSSQHPTTQPNVIGIKTTESLSNFWSEFKRLLSNAISDGVASPKLQELLDRFASASIPVNEKQAMLWDLRKETEDIQSRMVIYDMIERIGSEFIVGEIVDNFDTISSAEEQARVLELLNRSLEISNSSIANPTQRERLEGNSEQIVNLFEKQIINGNPSSPFFQKAINLFPNLVPTEQVIDTYDKLVRNQAITRTTYYDGVARVIFSENDSMQTYAPKFLEQLAKEDVSIRKVINPTIFAFLETPSIRTNAIPDEIKLYVESQKPSDYLNNKVSYFEWSSYYFDWIQAMNTITNNKVPSVTNPGMEPIERALIVNFRADALTSLNQGQLATLQATLHQASAVLSADSPHHNLYEQAITSVEEQRGKTQ